jgi:hypothetical protein
VRGLLIISAVAACAHGSPGGFVYTKEPVGVIVPASKGGDFYEDKQFKDFFTPTSAEVARLEAGLPAFVREYDPQSDLDHRLPTYRRHYVGIVVQGRRHIWVHGFCKESTNVDWRTEGFTVKEGGDCYFKAEYDIDRQKFVSFATNGYG